MNSAGTCRQAARWQHLSHTQYVLGCSVIRPHAHSTVTARDTQLTVRHIRPDDAGRCDTWGTLLVLGLLWFGGSEEGGVGGAVCAFPTSDIQLAGKLNSLLHRIVFNCTRCTVNEYKYPASPKVPLFIF